MILDAVSELYNSISFNNLDNVEIDNKFISNFEKPNFHCTFKSEGTDFIKFSYQDKLKLKNLKIYWKGEFEKLIIQISLDNFVWHTIFEGEFYDEETEFNEDEFFYIRFIFVNHKANFKLIQLEIKIDLDYDMDYFISHNSHLLIPTKIRERDSNLEDFCNTFLRMLERKQDMNKDFCNFLNTKIGVFYENIDYSTGGINSYAIDTQDIGDIPNNES